MTTFEKSKRRYRYEADTNDWRYPQSLAGQRINIQAQDHAERAAVRALKVEPFILEHNYNLITSDETAKNYHSNPVKSAFNHNADYGSRMAAHFASYNLPRELQPSKQPSISKEKMQQYADKSAHRAAENANFVASKDLKARNLSKKGVAARRGLKSYPSIDHAGVNLDALESHGISNKNLTPLKNRTNYKYAEMCAAEADKQANYHPLKEITGDYVVVEPPLSKEKILKTSSRNAQNEINQHEAKTYLCSPSGEYGNTSHCYYDCCGIAHHNSRGSIMFSTPNLDARKASCVAASYNCCRKLSESDSLNTPVYEYLQNEYSCDDMPYVVSCRGASTALSRGEKRREQERLEREEQLKEKEAFERELDLNSPRRGKLLDEATFRAQRDIALMEILKSKRNKHRFPMRPKEKVDGKHSQTEMRDATDIALNRMSNGQPSDNVEIFNGTYIPANVLNARAAERIEPLLNDMDQSAKRPTEARQMSQMDRQDKVRQDKQDKEILRAVNKEAKELKAREKNHETKSRFTRFFSRKSKNESSLEDDLSDSENPDEQYSDSQEPVTAEDFLDEDTADLNESESPISGEISPFQEESDVPIEQVINNPNDILQELNYERHEIDNTGRETSHYIERKTVIGSKDSTSNNHNS